MTRNMAELRAKLPGCRSSELLASLDRLSAENARQQHSAQRRLQELERQAAGKSCPAWLAAAPEAAPEAVPQAAPAAASPNPTVQVVSAACLHEAQAQIDLLTRKLSAVQAELLRCQTRLFAYEREMLALRRENAALEARCEAAQGSGARREQSGEIAVPDRFDAPAMQVFPPLAEDPAPRRAASYSAAVAERTGTLHCTQAPGKTVPPEPWEPRTELEQLAARLMEQMDRMLRA